MSHIDAIQQAAKAVSISEFKRIFNLKSDEEFGRHEKFFKEWFAATREGYITDVEIAIRVYTEARQAVICDAKPVAWSNAEDAFLEDRLSTLTTARWQATEKDDMPLYVALPKFNQQTAE